MKTIGKDDFLTKLLIKLGFKYITKRPEYVEDLEEFVGDASQRAFLGATEDVTNSAFGDSFTSAEGGYVAKLNADLDWNLFENGFSGKEIQDIAGSGVYPVEVPTGARYTLLTGYNDYRHNGVGTAATRDTYRRTLTASILWLLIPDSAKIKANDARVTYANGTWTDIGLFATPVNVGAPSGGGVSAKNTASNGATATLDLVGTAIYIGWSNRTVANNGGSFTVNVDGVDMVTVNTEAGIDSGNPPYLTVWPEMVRIGGLTPGKHEVVITTSTSSSNVTFTWFASNDGAGNPDWPFVFSSGPVRMNATGYTLSSPTFDNGSDVAAAFYNHLHDEVVYSLAADGWNVFTVNADRFYNPNVAANVSTDNIHPSDAGHEKIKEAFMSSIKGVLGGRDKLPLRSSPLKIHASSTETGDITINAPEGSVVFAATEDSLVLSNSYIHVGDLLSSVYVQVQTSAASNAADHTKTAHAQVTGEGRATIRLSAAATGVVRVLFSVR